MHPDDALQSLDAIHHSRATLAEQPTPASRHAAFAVLEAMLVASPAAPLPWRFAVFAFLFAGVAWVIRWDRQRTGMFINGYRQGRTRWVTGAMLVAVMPLYGLAIWLADGRGLWWAPLALAVPAFAICFFGSQFWCRVFAR